MHPPNPKRPKMRPDRIRERMLKTPQALEASSTFWSPLSRCTEPNLPHRSMPPLEPDVGESPLGSKADAMHKVRGDSSVTQQGHRRREHKPEGRGCKLRSGGPFCDPMGVEYEAGCRWMCCAVERKIFLRTLCKPHSRLLPSHTVVADDLVQMDRITGEHDIARLAQVCAV